MSHGIHDLSSIRQPARNQTGSESALPESILGASRGLGTPEEIRKEGLCDMLVFIFCPFASIRSFTAVVTIIDLVVYFATLIGDFNEKAYLTPTTAALDAMGAKNAYKMQQDLEIHRWIMPLFLHANIGHLLFNLITQMMFGFRFEPSTSWKETALVYFLSGYGGILMCCLMSPGTLSVGASGAIFGLLTATLGYIAARWEQLEGYPLLSYNVMMLFFTGAMCLMMNDNHADNWSHLGGILVGFSLSFALYLPENASWIKSTMKTVCYVGLFVYLLGGLFLFYLSTPTTPLTIV